MKVLYVSESLLPSSSANSVAILNMCHGIAEIGHRVELVAVDNREQHNIDIYKYYALKPIEGLKITLIPKLPGRRLQQIAILAYAGKAMRTAEFVYTRWNYAAILANILHRRNIIEYHKMPERARQHKVTHSVIKAEYTQKVVFITKSLKKEFEAVYGNSRKYVVEAGAAQKPSDRMEVPELVLDCGYMGSFFPGKGVEIVLQAAAKLPSVKFHIVGGELKKIEEMRRIYEVTDNVIWYGYRPYHEALELAQNFGIALLPNQSSVIVGKSDIGKYTSPNKMFEYMSQGKVVIASDLPVLREILKMI